MANWKNGIKKFFSLLMLAIFCWHLANTSLFPHVHNINGTKVSHSHPYAGTKEDPGHSHSSPQFETIAKLSLLIFILAAIAGILFSYNGRRTRHIVIRQQRCLTETFHTFFLRGPPLN